MSFVPFGSKYYVHVKNRRTSWLCVKRCILFQVLSRHVYDTRPRCTFRVCRLTPRGIILPKAAMWDSVATTEEEKAREVPEILVESLEVSNTKR